MKKNKRENNNNNTEKKTPVDLNYYTLYLLFYACARNYAKLIYTFIISFISEKNVNAKKHNININVSNLDVNTRREDGRPCF